MKLYFYSSVSDLFWSFQNTPDFCFYNFPSYFGTFSKLTYCRTKFGDFTAENKDFKLSKKLLDVDGHCGPTSYIWEDPNVFFLLVLGFAPTLICNLTIPGFFFDFGGIFSLSVSWKNIKSSLSAVKSPNFVLQKFNFDKVPN